jgi:hypothetical protein
MTLTELLSQIDLLDHTERLTVLDHLIDGLEHEGAGSEDDEADEDARWDQSFANSQELLSRMAARARQNRDQGQNRELDPDSL